MARKLTLTSSESTECFNTFRFIHLAYTFQGDLVKRQAIHHMESTAPAILQYAKPKNT